MWVISIKLDFKTNAALGPCLETLKKAIEMNPNDVGPYPNIGLCYQRLKKYDSAIYYLYKGIAVNPGYNASYENLAFTFKAMGKTDSAKKYEAVARAKNPAFML